jgi:hypothetical protein
MLERRCSGTGQDRDSALTETRCVHLLGHYIIHNRASGTVYALGSAQSLAACSQSYTVMTPTPAKRALPSKESSLFRELLNLYETRQLKKGQKTADQILKKFPEHGGPYHLCMDRSV